jgi:hypothetical protein
VLVSEVGSNLRISNGEGILTPATDQNSLDRIGIEVTSSDVVDRSHGSCKEGVVGRVLL